MKSRFIFILLIAISFPLLLIAQNVRLINSTQQSWSGGVAGRMGSNYIFTIEFSGFKTDPLPDTLWIGQEPTPIVIIDSSNAQSANTKRIHKKNTFRFEISAGTATDEYADRYPRDDSQPYIAPHAPIAYKGIALLSYRYKRAVHYFEISKIIKTYEPINYP